MNEEERIAVRCTRRELALLDSFVQSGEFATRSELIRAALRDFLVRRAREAPASASPPAPASQEWTTSSVRLRPDEAELYQAYGDLVANGAPLGDLLAQLVRRGALELKVEELVASHRSQVRTAAERRAQYQGLKRSAEDLQRQGVLGP